MLSRLRCIFALAFCLVLSGGGSFAQEFRATVQGTISDQSGASVPGANVVLTNIGTGVESRASTNAAGLYAFQFLQPGSYRLTATAELAPFQLRYRDATLRLRGPATAA